MTLSSVLRSPLVLKKSSLYVELKTHICLQREILISQGGVFNQIYLQFTAEPFPAA